MLTRSLLAIVLLLSCACAEPSDSRTGTPAGSGGALPTGTGGASSGDELPAGFIAADRGGWRLGAELEGAVGGGSAGAGGGEEEREPCDTTLLAVVRDFRRGDVGEEGHPDFQTFSGSGASHGIVAAELGPEEKPIHLAEGAFVGPFGQQTSGRERFDEWYRTTAEVNRAYLLELAFVPDAGVLTFQSSAFFPLDGAGFGNEQLAHNYHFTTELHTEFVYRAGDRFTFTGDDDLWVFVEGRLVIDLGGLHGELSETIALDDLADELGLRPGETYRLDLFHAERRAVYSNFRVDTTLEFTGCRVLGPIVR